MILLNSASIKISLKYDPIRLLFIRKLITFLSRDSLIFSINLFAQSNKILSGPMVSYVDAYSAQVWFLLESEVKKIDFEIRNYEDDKLLQFSFNVTNKHNLDEIPFTVLLDKLQPNKEYMASVFVDDVLFQEIDIFTQIMFICGIKNAY